MTLIDNGLELLAPAQCRDLLERTAIGRVAVTVAALPAIFPVNYAILGDDIVFLTGEGTKLRAALERPSSPSRSTTSTSPAPADGA